MFRRLFTTLALLVVALLGGLALAVQAGGAGPGGRGGVWALFGVALVLGLGAAAALAAALAWQITRPLNDLTHAVERMGAGTGQPRVFPTAHDEVSLLGETFNVMSERLSGRIAALEEDR